MARNLKTKLMLSGAFGGFTANERRLGRFIRDGEGHPAPAPAAEPAAEPVAQMPLPPQSSDDLYEAEYGGSIDPVEPPKADEELLLEDEVPPAPEEKKEPKGASAEERINEATAAQREAERLLAESRRDSAALEARLAALEKGVSPPKPKEEVKERGPDEAPNPDDYEFGEADAKFLADHSAFHAVKAVKDHAAKQELEQQVQGIETAWTEAIAAPDIAEQYPDFEEKVTQGATAKAWACTPVMALLIKSSAVGPDVAYHLATTPAESKRIASLDDNEQILEIGRLEGRYLARKETAPATTVPAKKVVTDAPAPPSNRSRGSGGQFVQGQDAVYDKMLTEFK